MFTPESSLYIQSRLSNAPNIATLYSLHQAKKVTHTKKIIPTQRMLHKDSYLHPTISLQQQFILYKRVKKKITTLLTIKKNSFIPYNLTL